MNLECKRSVLFTMLNFSVSVDNFNDKNLVENRKLLQFSVYFFELQKFLKIAEKFKNFYIFF